MAFFFDHVTVGKGFLAISVNGFPFMIFPPFTIIPRRGMAWDYLPLTDSTMREKRWIHTTN